MLKQTDISERRACLLVEISRTVLHYMPKVRLENERKVEWLSWPLNVAVLVIDAFMLC